MSCHFSPLSLSSLFMKKVIVIFDNIKAISSKLIEFPSDTTFIFFGSSRAIDQDNVICLFDILELNRDKYVKSFDSFVSDFNEHSSLHSIEILPGLLNGTLSLLGHRDFFASSNKFSILLALFALKDILDRLSPLPYVVHANIKDPLLSLSIHQYLKQHSFPTATSTYKLPLAYMVIFKTLSNLFANLLKALFYYSRQVLISFSSHTHVRKHQHPSQLLIVTPFCNFNKEDVLRGVYNSYLWNPLLNILRQSLEPVSIFHFFVSNPALKNPRSASKAISELSSRSAYYESHLFSFWFLSLANIMKSFFYYIIYNCRLSTRIVSHLYLHLKSPLYPLYLYIIVDDVTSLNSAHIYSGLSFYNMFNSYLKSSSEINTCIYTCENQPWERFLNLALSKNFPNCSIYAFCHTTIRKWDLRYYNTSLLSSSNHLASPSKFLVSAPHYFTLLSNIGYPANKIKCVEALRFYEFANFVLPDTSNTSQQMLVTIFGDYNPATTTKMLSLFLCLDPSLRNHFKFQVKQHPVFHLDNTLDSLFNDVSSESITDILSASHCAVFSPTSSVSLIALFNPHIYCAYYSSHDQLDTSPLSSYSYPTFSSLSELSYLLSELVAGLKARPSPVFPSNSCFFLSDSLSLWKTLLINK
jgi:surface carbohydrate biosynthesis protein (TIGR04326 family)